MGWVDTHLDAGERVLFRTRLHPVVFGGTVMFSLCVFGAAALIVARNDLAPATVRLLWLGAAFTVVVSWVPPLVRWWTCEFAATTRRLLVKMGLVRVRIVEVSATHPESVEVEETVCGRWLGYGTLRLVGDENVLHVFPRVAGADELREAVRRRPSSAARPRAR